MHLVLLRERERKRERERFTTSVGPARPMLPLPVTKLRSIFRFRVGAPSLPVEQGSIEMPQVPRHLRRCTFCATDAIGDERHCVFDCPHFQGLRQQRAQIFQDSHGAMRSLMWDKDQMSVCALGLAIHCQRGPDSMTDSSS